jgi:hypothetical protein
MTIITACIIASTVVNIHQQTTINGVTYGPRESVVTQCVTEPEATAKISDVTPPKP